MSERERLAKRRTWRALIFVTATAGWFLFEFGLMTNAGSMSNWESISGLVILCLSTLAGLSVYLASKKNVPPTVKPLLATTRQKWERESSLHSELGVASLILGAGMEWLFGYVSAYLAIVPLLYVAASVYVYYKVRSTLILAPHIAMFAFFVSWSSVPFAIVALRDPQTLQRALFVFDIPTSRSISFLFFPWLQFALVFSTAMLLTQAWRTLLLVRSEINADELHDLHELVLKNYSTAPWVKEFSTIFSEIPHLLSLFEQGDFSAVVSLGWGDIDRGLTLVSSKRHIKPRAIELGINETEFDLAYQARTDAVHKGINPSYKDALNTLLLIKHILEIISERQTPSEKQAGEHSNAN